MDKNSYLSSPKKKSILFRPWLWVIKLFERRASPIPANIWLINIFFQRILGQNNSVPWMVHFTSQVKGRVSIGNNVWKSFALSGGCYIQVGNGIEIADDTIVGPGVKIISANHSSENSDVWIASKPIIIGKGCWIGANSVILPDVELGDNTIVGAGSIVTKSFNGNCIIAGNPAKVIKTVKKQDKL